MKSYTADSGFFRKRRLLEIDLKEEHKKGKHSEFIESCPYCQDDKGAYEDFVYNQPQEDKYKGK